MTFGAPALLALLLVVPLAVLVYAIFQARRPRYAVRFTNLSMLANVMPRRSAWRRHLPPALYLLSLAALVVALARPFSTIKLPRQEGTVTLVIDVSGSMDATDVSPTRLTAAISDAERFVNQLPARFQVGVVAFSTSAEVLTPPTSDRDRVRQALESLRANGGTAMGDGIERALDFTRQPPASPPTTHDRLLKPGEGPTGTPTPSEPGQSSAGQGSSASGQGQASQPRTGSSGSASAAGQGAGQGQASQPGTGSSSASAAGQGAGQGQTSQSGPGSGGGSPGAAGQGGGQGQASQPGTGSGGSASAAGQGATGRPSANTGGQGAGPSSPAGQGNGAQPLGGSGGTLPPGQTGASASGQPNAAGIGAGQPGVSSNPAIGQAGGPGGSASTGGQGAAGAPSSGANKPPAAVLLLSDGASNSGDVAPEVAAQDARKLGVPVYTIALGTAGGTLDMRVPGGRGIRRIAVPPDPAQLKQVAGISGGQFFEAPSEQDLRHVYENLASHIGFDTQQQDITPLFVATAAILLLAGGALATLWFHRFP